MEPTLNISHALVENLLESLGVLKLLLNLGDDGLGKLALLPLLDLTLVADPGLEDGLGFVGNGRLLLELESLSLKLGRLLCACQQTAPVCGDPSIPYPRGSFIPWKPRTGTW
jgi:hypothetical protein